jgi:hypothetical protein
MARRRHNEKIRRPPRPLILLTAGGMLAACGGSNSNSTTVPPVQLTVGAMVPRTGPNASDETKSHDTQVEFARLGAKIVTAEASGSAIGGNKANYDGSLMNPVPIVAFSATSGSLNKATATDTNPQRQAALQDLDNWFFRTAMVTDVLSVLRLRMVYGRDTNGDVNGDGIVKVVFIGTSDAGSTSSLMGDVKAFTNAVPAGATLSTEAIQFDPGADPTVFNYGDVLAKATDNFNETTQMIDGLPDIIVNKCLPNISISMIRAYNQAGYQVPILADGSYRRNTILAALGTAADGSSGTSYVAYERNASGQVFATEQQARTMWAPAAYEAQAYDAMTISLLAATKAALALDDPSMVTPAQVRDALAQMNDPAGQMVRTGPDELKKGIQLMAQGMPSTTTAPAAPSTSTPWATSAAAP